MSDENDYWDGYNHGSGGYYDSDKYNNNDSYRQGIQHSQSCFPGDTDIQTPGGSRRISTIAPGTIVMSWDATRSQLVERKVSRLKSHKPARIVTVELSNGTSLRATPNHTVLTRSGWRRIDRLKPSDQMILATGDAAKINSITSLPDKVPVYNLVTEGEHTFVANGVVAHNFTHLRRLRTALHVVAESIAAIRPKSKARSRETSTPIVAR